MAVEYSCLKCKLNKKVKIYKFKNNRTLLREYIFTRLNKLVYFRVQYNIFTYFWVNNCCARLAKKQ